MRDNKPTSWTDNQWDYFLRKLQVLSNKKKAHWEAYYYCEHRDKCINLPLVLLSSLLSTTAMSQIGLSSDSDNSSSNTYLSGFITGTSLIITGLTTYSKYYNYASLKEAHRLTSLNYFRLRSELVQLIEEKDTTDTYSVFLKTFFSKVAGIKENSPILPDCIYKKYRDTRCKQLKNKVVPYTEEPADSTTIDIHESQTYVDSDEEYDNQKKTT